MIIGSLRTWLLAQSAVTSLIVSGGVFPSKVPQGTAGNCIVLDRMDEDENLCLGGRPAVGAALFTAEIDIDCKGTTVGNATSLSEVVAGLFRDFTGSLGASLESVGAVETIGKSDDFSADPSARDVGFFTVTLSYRVFYWPIV